MRGRGTFVAAIDGATTHTDTAVATIATENVAHRRIGCLPLVASRIPSTSRTSAATVSTIAEPATSNDPPFATCGDVAGNSTVGRR